MEAACTFETSTTLSARNHIYNNSRKAVTSVINHHESLKSAKTVDYIDLKDGSSCSNWKISGTNNVTTYADNVCKESVRLFMVSHDRGMSFIKFLFTGNRHSNCKHFKKYIILKAYVQIVSNDT
jgi:hypothetical protein